MIEVNDLHKGFGGEEVLKGISANFYQGKTNLIIGQSGSGKTVFLKSLVGLHQIDQGEIIYNDRRLGEMDDEAKKELRTEMGMVFQGNALFDSLTIQENINFALGMFGDMSESEMEDRANFCLKRVNLEGVNNKFPAELSGGMQKRVALARAIVMNPKYLFCDEPNSGLDPKTAIVIDNLIKEITEEYNMTTVINTHDMNSVMEIGDQIIYIKYGLKAWEGSSEDILTTDNEDINDFVYSSELFRKIKNKL
ncbi:ABC transporter ATP-binding protein [Owenweeksia hongkongensis]|uniref:ABC transporter ATP-binding protein n=1 Tax=Owenweeksia hongkongensis TaxID=253245 RepID=UPI003A8ED6CA